LLGLSRSTIGQPLVSGQDSRFIDLPSGEAGQVFLPAEE
jgi:hypothetical protein